MEHILQSSLLVPPGPGAQAALRQLCTAIMCRSNFSVCLMCRICTQHSPLMCKTQSGPCFWTVRVRALPVLLYQPAGPTPWSSAYPGDIVHTEEGVCYEQRLDGAQLVGGAHVPRAIECACAVLAQHAVEVLQGLRFPGSFSVLQAGREVASEQCLAGV